MDCDIVKCMRDEYFVRDTEGEHPIHLEEFQPRVLNHAFTPNPDGSMPYGTVVLSMPKKSGKTGLAGGITHGFVRTIGGNCYSIANDEEQAASRMFDREVDSLNMASNAGVSISRQVEFNARDNFQTGNRITYCQNNQKNPGPHWLQYIANDYGGEAGGMQALTVWDELWNYSTKTHYRLWDEMQPIPILPVSMRLITTYAGWYGESELLWNIYNNVVKPDPQTEEATAPRVKGLEDLPCYELGNYFVYWDHECRMPWHTEEFLSDARNDPALEGRESEFRRIWQNRWTTGLEAYMPMETVDLLMELGEKEGLYNHLESYA